MTQTDTMENICATFEEWYICDGTYPPLKKGQKVNLAFYIQPNEKTITTEAEYYIRQVKNSDYEFCGKVIRDYQDTNNHLIVVDTKQVIFYIELEDNNEKALEGLSIKGQGRLLIDYYIWAEYFCNYQNAPDLFYNFKIAKIRKVKIPDKFIYRNEKAFLIPTSLSTNDYDDDDTEEIEDMNINLSDTSFFLLDLTSINEKIEKTIV